MTSQLAILIKYKTGFFLKLLHCNNIRNFLEWKGDRHGQPSTGWKCHRQNGRRNCSGADGTSKNACTRRWASSYINRWQRNISRSNVGNMGRSTRVWWARGTTKTSKTRKKLAISSSY